AIPYRENGAAKPAFFPKILYKGRARAEQGVGKIKRFKRIALRCEKTAQNFAAFIALACTFILVKSVHTAECSRLSCSSRRATAPQAAPTAKRPDANLRPAQGLHGIKGAALLAV